MLLQDFKKQFFELALFSTNQVYAWYPDFDKNNFTRWAKQGYIIKIRQGFYCFSEYVSQPNFDFFVANTIYSPSYISLHTALAFYGIIPETVVQTTSISTLKTMFFKNDLGQFSYSKIKNDLFCGYSSLPFNSTGERVVLIAQPEKAILDLLYVYPQYSTEEKILNLRFDEYIMRKELNKSRLKKYLKIFDNRALNKKIEILQKIYDL